MTLNQHTNESSSSTKNDGNDHEDATPSTDSIRHLSGLSRAEAHKIVRTWHEQDADSIIETIHLMRDTSLKDPSLEFDTVLKSLLRHQSPAVRIACLDAMAGNSDMELATLTIDLLEHDTSHNVKCAAARVLGALTENAELSDSHQRRVIIALTKAAKSTESTQLRGEALVAIAAIPRFDATELISELKDTPSQSPETTIQILTAMGKTSDRYWLPHITDALGNHHAEVRATATISFGMIATNDEDVAMLNEPLDDHVLEVQLAAIQALRNIGSQSAREMLKQAQDNSEPEVAHNAKEALKALKAEDELIYAVSPEMLERGLYGAAINSTPDRDLTRYNAPTQEGWAHLISSGEEINMAPAAEDIGEDMEDYLESDEFFKSSNN